MSNQRRNAISILRGISIRMPLLIYGAELKSEDEEITIHNFASLIDDQSWEEFMPKGVDKEKFDKFKKYYDPDIFREAGKRIREMARAADKFTIEERIERIATIFNTFRNPDKETVLTPWRVVNMHMSDCLGGWCFYDEEFKNTLSIPRYVEQGKVTKDVFRPDAHILEINSKSGLYPLYVAYNIYRSRVEAAKAKYGEVSHGFAKNLWDATIEENILVVCKTPMAKSITKRTLAGFRDTKVNAQYYPNLIENISERPEAVVNTFRDGKHFWKINDQTNMKLDAIVGNPPYQSQTTEKGIQATPLYQHFVKLAIAIKASYISMIMPSRWFAGGMGLDDFRQLLMKDDSFVMYSDFSNSKDCFSNISISGGIGYFLRNYNYHGLCQFKNTINGKTSTLSRKMDEFDIIVRYNEAISILRRLKLKKEDNLRQSVSAISPFGISTSIRGHNNPSSSTYKLFSSQGQSFINKEDLTKGFEWIGKYKVLVSQTGAEHAMEPSSDGKYRVLTSSMQAIGPKDVCTHSYILIGPFDRKEEADNLLGYLKTRFVRFLLLQCVSSIHISRATFQFVPLQDFSKPWTDEELYTKYGLTEDEIAFIESMIKPME